MDLNGVSIPKRLWLELLSYLDGKTLRKTLMVSRKWYEMGSDQSLDHLSNRGNIKKIKDLKRKNFIQLINFLLTTKSNELDWYERAMKTNYHKLIKNANYKLYFLCKNLPMIIFYLKRKKLTNLSLIISLFTQLSSFVQKESNQVLVVFAKMILAILDSYLIGKHFHNSYFSFLSLLYVFYNFSYLELNVKLKIDRSIVNSQKSKNFFFLYKF